MRILKLRTVGIAIGPEFSRDSIANPWQPIIDDYSRKLIDDYHRHSDAVYSRHNLQTLAEASALNEKYRSRILFGKISVRELLEKLALVVDTTDYHFFQTNQLIHSLQVVEAMKRDGVSDSEMLLAGLIHDVGKVLALTGEAPENVFCANKPIGNYQEGVGLDNVTFQWNHDEFGYLKLKDLVPENVAKLIRYHSIDFEAAKPLLSDSDAVWFDKYLKVFRHYDLDFKSPFRLIHSRLDDYQSLLDRYFPKEITF